MVSSFTTDPTAIPSSTTPCRILLVDDHPALRRTLAALLQHAGHKTIEAIGGAATFQRLADSSPDLVLTDLALSDVTGWEVARAAKRRTPPLPVIVLTGPEEPLPSPERRALGDRMLTKPVALPALLDAIASLRGAPVP